MSKANSPTYTQGMEDGQRDCEIVGQCPAGDPIGPQPPFPAYPVMYLAGYDETFSHAVYHEPCPRCRPQREQ